MTLNNLLASPAFAAWMEGEPLDIQRLLYTPDRQAAAVDHVDRPSVRRRADVLRHDPAERNPGLDAHAARHVAACGRLLYMDEVFGYFPPTGQSAGEDADAHAAQAGPRVRPGRRAGDAEPGRPRLQGTVERRHLVPGPAANRARQGPRARRAGRRVGRGRARRSIAQKMEATLAGARQPRLPDEQRARRCSRSCSNRAGRCRTCAGR